MGQQPLTIGIEEEFQIVRADGELQAHIDTLLASAKPILGEDVKAEMLQSVVEVGTRICAGVAEAREEVLRLRGTLASLLEPQSMRIVSAGTHPFSHWRDQRITELDRYKMIEDEMQDVVRELLIFGMHVSNEEFTSYVDLLVRTGSIDNGKKIWWDLRPHWQYPTIEFRVCDACTKVDEVLCIAALIQAICAKLLLLRARNLGFRKYLPSLISENKWRAMRYGIDGKLIDFGKAAEVPMRELAFELLEFVDDVVDDLDSRKEVEYLNTILREGTSADRQLRVYQDTGSLEAVVEHLAAETLQGVPRRPTATSGPA